MGLFSRRHHAQTGNQSDQARRSPDAPAGSQHLGQEAQEADAPAGTAALADAPGTGSTDPATQAPGGPWDVSHAPDYPGGRIDLGALHVPAVDGMQLRLDEPGPDGTVAAVVLVLAGSSLELRAFAAPRSEGIWEGLRADIAAELSGAGASYQVLDGPHGRELLANVPLRTPDGQQTSATVRFLGADGPRWFLRGVLQGPAATDAEAATDLRALFDEVVVVRGHEARPPREVLPLHMPDLIPATAGAPSPAGQEEGAGAPEAQA